VKLLCRLAGMSRQNYYHQRQERQRQPRLGGRKLWWLLAVEFQRAGVALGRDRFFAVLRRHKVLILRRRKGCRTTDSRHGFWVYTNLAQDLVLTGAHQLWVSDITYLATAEGFLYLALVMDACSRMIVGFRTQRHAGSPGGAAGLAAGVQAAA
jgi:putative transposase